MTAKAIKFGTLGDLFSKAYHFTKGAKFAQIHTAVDPIKAKASIYAGRVVKRQSHNVQLNFSYSNAVNNQRMAEGLDPDFVPQAPKWGTRVPGTPLISHTKKGTDITSFYLMTRVLRSMPASYYLDGQQVLDVLLLDDVLGHTRASYSNKSQGLEKEIIIRTFKLDSIKAITMDGETLVVEK